MRLRILLAASFLLVGASLEATTYRCKWDDSCYFCIGGDKMDDCSVTCNVCTGFRCRGAGMEAPELTAEIESLNAEPVAPLYRFSTKDLGKSIHPAIGLVFENFWRWYDMPQRVRREPLDIVGGVAIAGEPHEYTLHVRQRGDDQVYFLDVEAFGKVTLTARKPRDGRQELEFELERQGERARVGHIMVE